MVYKIPTEGIATGAIGSTLLSTSVTNALVPIKGIIMFSGTENEIPTGWYLCDGNNGTPDLTDKFVVGTATIDTNDNNKWKSDVDGTAKSEGGNATKTLGTNELPSHTHDITDSGHTHNLNYEQKQVEDTGGAWITDIRRAGGDGDGGSTSYTNDNTSGFMESANTGITSTDSQPGTTGEAFDILPPFFALAFIMRG